MKSSVKHIVLVLFVCMWCVCVGCRGIRIKYPSGRDTRESYGDGTFQLLSLSKTNQLFLSNEAYNSIVLYNVQGIRESDGVLYAVGRVDQCTTYFSADLSTYTMCICTISPEGADSKVYIYRLDEMKENGDLVCYHSLAEFPETARNVFDEIE